MAREPHAEATLEAGVRLQRSRQVETAVPEGPLSKLGPQVRHPSQFLGRQLYKAKFNTKFTMEIHGTGKYGREGVGQVST